VERLPENVEIALFRVIQESLNNIHRHSGADRVSIELTNGAKAIVLRISDNGKGLPPEVLGGGPGRRASFGVGILGMKERLSQLGGTLNINSSKKGTVVEAKVPAKQGK
jgi:two-component system NarL family sensor kinase